MNAVVLSIFTLNATLRKLLSARYLSCCYAPNTKMFTLYFEHVRKPGCSVTNTVFVTTAAYFMHVHFMYTSYSPVYFFSYHTLMK